MISLAPLLQGRSNDLGKGCAACREVLHSQTHVRPQQRLLVEAANDASAQCNGQSEVHVGCGIHATQLLIAGLNLPSRHGAVLGPPRNDMSHEVWPDTLVGQVVWEEKAHSSGIMRRIPARNEASMLGGFMDTWVCCPADCCSVFTGRVDMVVISPWRAKKHMRVS